ncbi:MAG TPA: EF-hand domain-containing protein [Sphingomicrobium sp.]|nr:EF-hand domain-containing protein [Sphingomicrobium sp.]
MRLSVLVLPLLVSAAQSTAAPEGPIVVTGHPWAPFISPMGEPFRARSTSDDTLAMWFVNADRNHDGYLTSDELQADAERFFAKLDSNHDGEIDPDELVQYEWEVAPEIQVNSRWKRDRRDAQQPTPAKSESEHKPAHHGREEKERWANIGWHGGGPNDVLEGAARYALLNIPEPVAAADADFNRGVSLAEFRQAAQARFLLLDRNRQGKVSLADLQAMKAALPSPGRPKKIDSDAIDTRVGAPLPPGN